MNISTYQNFYCELYLYYALFVLGLIYACQIRGRKEAVIRKLLQLQNNATKIVRWKPNYCPTDAQLYHSSKILKIADYIKLLNCTFVKNILATDYLSNFQGTSRSSKKHASALHNY